jgi:capsid protein
LAEAERVHKVRTSVMARLEGIAKGEGMKIGPATARYEAARRNRLNPKKDLATGGAAFTHLVQVDADAIRNDCNAAARDNPIARAFVKRSQDFTVGDGPIIKATTSNPEWNAAHDRLMLAFAAGDLTIDQGMSTVPVPVEPMGRDLASVLRLVDKAWKTDGDILLIDRDLAKDGAMLQLVEAARVRKLNERFSGGGGKKPAGQNDIVAGVEINAIGKPVRYHVTSWGFGGTSVNYGDTVPIDAAACDLVINPVDDTAGMVRGEPGLQAVLQLLERIDAFVDKTLLAAEIATLFSLVVTHPQPAAFQQAMVQAADAAEDREPENATKQVDLQPGVMQTLPLGATVEQVKPEHPTTNFRDFVHTLIMLAAADGAGLPMAATHLEAGGLSWSNIKALLAMGYRSIEVKQDRLRRIVRRLRRRVVMELIRLGALPPVPVDAQGRSEMDKLDVIFPNAPVLDFASESKGYGDAVRDGLMTSDEATQRLGTGTAESVTRAIASEQDLRRELGVVTMAMPGATPITGGTAGTGGASGGEVDAVLAEAETATVQDTALNGAQVEALIGLVEKVVLGQLSFESARAIAEAAFPAVDPALIDKIFNGAKSFKPTPPADDTAA